MPIEVSWLVKNRILYAPSYGINDISDFERLDAAMLRFLKESDAASVHVIYDLQEQETIPPLWESLRFKWSYLVDPRFGWNIFVQVNNPLHKILISLVGKILKIHISYFDSPIEALDFLQSIDSTLPNLTLYKDRFITRV